MPITRKRKRDDSAPIRPPDFLLQAPVVEDWIRRDEIPWSCGVSPMARGPEDEDERAWMRRQLAGERWKAAVRDWQREHPRFELPPCERRRWMLNSAPGSAPARWHDRAAFMARVRS